MLTTELFIAIISLLPALLLVMPSVLRVKNKYKKTAPVW